MMLDYEWGNPAAAAAAAAMLLFGDGSDGGQQTEERVPAGVFDHYGGNGGFFAPPPQQLTAAALFSGAPACGQRYGLGMPVAGAGRIGLNLGVRTYFSSASPEEEMAMRGRVCRRRMRTARCQAEGCGSDLTHAKNYHRRHKVCEFHSKASIVIAAGLSQRFCQQCSRFHVLSEFDQGKRSCRKRLADHNRRRRKSQDLTTINAGQNGGSAAAADNNNNVSAKQELVLDQFHDTSSSSNNNNNNNGNSNNSTVTRAADSPPPSIPTMGLGLGCGGFSLSPAGLSGSSSTVTSPPRMPFFSHLGDFRGGGEHRFLSWDDGDDGSSIRCLYDHTK